MTWRFNLKSAGTTKGFSLIEIVVSLGIVSIVMAALFCILHFTSITTKKVEDHDSGLITAIYSLEYIIDEVKTADEIYPIEECPGLKEKYPNHLGFITMEKEGTQFNYRTYYEGEGSIIRIAKMKSVKLMPSAADFSGHNRITENIIDTDGSYLDIENELVYISIEVPIGEGTTKTYKTCISVKGRVID